MDKLAAKIISLLTAPELVFPLGIFALVANSNLTQVMSALLFVVVGGFPPIALGVYQYFHEKDQEIEPGREARQSIYLVAVFAFTVNTILFGSDIVPNMFWANMGMVMAIFFAVAYLVNKYFDKFSMHMAMYSFVIMLLLDHVHLSYALFFVFIPLIIWARLRLDKHTWLQLLFGWAIGLGVGLLAWTL